MGRQRENACHISPARKSLADFKEFVCLIFAANAMWCINRKENGIIGEHSLRFEFGICGPKPLFFPLLKRVFLACVLLASSGFRFSGFSFNIGWPTYKLVVPRILSKRLVHFWICRERRFSVSDKNCHFSTQCRSVYLISSQTLASLELQRGNWIIDFRASMFAIPRKF